MIKKNNSANYKIIWITWESHRRTIELCKHFEFKLLIYVSNRCILLKYPYLIFKTICALMVHRPQTLIVQNPSVVLTFVTCAVKKIFGYFLIVDAHNAGIIPENKILLKLPFIFKYLQRKADITIVTNMQLSKIISSNNGRPFVMPDKIPEIKLIRRTESRYDIIRVVYICKFADDEPYNELINTAGNFDRRVLFYVTGSLSKVPKHILDSKPSNVIFTGFLSETDYWELLCLSDLIIDLTKREDCLLCGAYEALAAEVPMLLSDTAALRNYFYKGAVFTKNTTEGLSRNIVYALNNLELLKNDLLDAKMELHDNWLNIANKFMVVVRLVQNKLLS